MRKFRAFIEQSVRASTFTTQLRRFCFVGLRTPPITWRDMIFVVYSSANSPLKQATGPTKPWRRTVGDATRRRQRIPIFQILIGETWRSRMRVGRSNAENSAKDRKKT